MRLCLLGAVLALVTLCGGMPAARGAALSGRVYVDRNGNGIYDLGEPCVQAVVSLRSENGGPEQTATAACGPTPGYLFAGLPLGNYVLSVQTTTPPDYLPSASQRRKLVRITDETPVQLDLPVYPRAGTIHGRVFEDLNGTGRYSGSDPCVQSVVSLQPVAGGAARTATVDCRYGVYAFRSVEPGKYLLSVQETTPPDFGGFPVVVTVPPGGTIEQDLPLLRPHVEGIITTPEHQPLTDVVLLLHDASGRTVAVTTSDADGQYQFDALRAGVYRIIAADPPGAVDGDARPGAHAVKVDRTTLEVTIVSGVTQYEGNNFTKRLSPASPRRTDRLLAVGDPVAVAGQLGFSALAPVDLDSGRSAIRRLTDDGTLFVLQPDGSALLQLGAGQSRVLLDTTTHDPADGVSLTRLLRVETGRDGSSAVLALRADNSRGIYRLGPAGLTRLALLPGADGLAELAISDGGQVAYVSPSAADGPALFQGAGALPVASVAQVQGATVDALTDLTANDAGDLAFLAQLGRTDAQGVVTHSGALLRKTHAGLSVAALSGQTVRLGNGDPTNGQILGIERPMIGPDGTIVFGAWGQRFRNFYAARLGRSLAPVLPSGDWSFIAADFDEAVAADGSVAVRASPLGTGIASLYLTPPGGAARLIAGGVAGILEPVGQPAFGPDGQLFFLARNRGWLRDRNGLIPVGLFRYRPGDPGPASVAVLDQTVPGQAGQRLLDVPQRPVVSASAVAFPALFGGGDRFPVPTVGLFRVPLDSTLDKDGVLVVAEGDELSFPAQVVGFRDFYFTEDGTLIFDTVIRRWLVVGEWVGSWTSGASTARAARTQAAPSSTPIPLLTKGDDLGSGRKLQQVLGRLVPIGPSRDLFAAQFSQGGGAGEGLFTIDRSKQIQTVAVTDDPATGPGLSGAHFIGFGDTPAYTLSPLSVSADGNVVFKALLDRAGITTLGVFQWTTGAATAVGVMEPNPDLLKLAPDDRPPYRLNRWAAGTSGQAYFLEQHQNTFDAPVARLFGRSAAGPVPLVVPGKTPVAGSPAPLDQVSDFVVVPDGSVFVQGRSAGLAGVLALRPTGLMPVAREGEAVPPSLDGRQFPGLVFDGSFSLDRQSACYGLYFTAGVWKPHDVQSRTQGLFLLSSQGVLATALLAGSDVNGLLSVSSVQTPESPDQPCTQTFHTQSLSQSPSPVTEPLAFAARSSDGHWGIYRSQVVLDPRTGQSSLTVTLVAREGQPLPNGSTLVSLDPSALLRRATDAGPLFRVNAAGEVAFLATDGQHWGIYHFSDSGG